MVVPRVRAIRIYLNYRGRIRRRRRRVGDIRFILSGLSQYRADVPRRRY